MIGGDQTEQNWLSFLSDTRPVADAWEVGGGGAVAYPDSVGAELQHRDFC